MWKQGLVANRDSYAWRCKTPNMQGVRNGSLLEGSRLTLEKWMQMIFFWAYKTPFTFIHAMLDIDNKTEEAFRMGLQVAMQTQTEGLV